MEVIVKDGDTLVVVVEVGPSVFDPCGMNPAITNAFRVIANKNVLKLVKLGDTHVLSAADFEQVKQRAK